MDPLVSTALRGYVDSVKTLLRDAVGFGHGDHTRLIEICEVSYGEMVTNLIQSGADVNKIDANGYSNTYTCVKPGELKCMKQLVDKEPDIYMGFYGLTPLRLASAMRQTLVVEYLLGSSSCRRADKIEALELIGVKCVKDDHFESAWGYWLRSLEERLLAEPDDLVQPQLTHLAYGEPFHTVEELNMIASSKEDMWMQALIMLENIPSHHYPNDFYYSVVKGACFYLETVNYRRCISIAMHILDKRSLGVLDLHCPALSILGRVISRLWSKDTPEPYEVVMPMLIEGVRLTELAMQMPTFHWLQSPSRIIDEIVTFVFCPMGYLSKRQPEMLDKDHIRFKQLIKEFVKLNPHDNTNRRLLHILLDRLDWSPFPSEIVGLLLEAGADPTVADQYNNTPLHLACKQHTPVYRCTEVIKLLLEAGVDLEAINCYRETPLLVACRQNDSSYPMFEVVQLLLQGGANPQGIDSRGNTPMHLMAMNSHPSKHHVIRLLLSKCCSCALHMCNEDGKRFTDCFPAGGMISEMEKSCDLCSLQCLSAKAVSTYSIAYESQLPTPLAQFVKMHCRIKVRRPLHPIFWKRFLIQNGYNTRRKSIILNAAYARISKTHKT